MANIITFLAEETSPNWLLKVKGFSNWTAHQECLERLISFRILRLRTTNRYPRKSILHV